MLLSVIARSFLGTSAHFPRLLTLRFVELLRLPVRNLLLRFVIARRNVLGAYEDRRQREQHDDENEAAKEWSFHEVLSMEGSVSRVAQRSQVAKRCRQVTLDFTNAPS